MRKLNISYFEFFFFRYGVIVIFVHLLVLPISLFGKGENDPVFLACATIVCSVFLLLICSSEYSRLRKNLPPSDVFLADNNLIINETRYSSEQIEEITYLSLENALDKSPLLLFEIKTNDNSVFYFLDKRRNWKLESQTMKILNDHPVFSLKTKDKIKSSKGFSYLKSRNNSEK